MKNQLVIPLEDFPETGLKLSGELDSAILALDSADLQYSAGIHYELHAQVFDRELLVRGSLSLPCSMRCVRCLDSFDYCITTPSFSLTFELGDSPALDITDALREELILAIPPYPKCEFVDKECQILDLNRDFRLDKAPPSGVDSATPSSKSVWDALDHLSVTPPLS